MTNITGRIRESTSNRPYRLSFKEMGEFRRDQMNTIAELTARLGRVAHVSMLGIPLYFISEPAIIREILIRHTDELKKDRFTMHMFKRFLGEGLVTAEGEPWQQQRKLMQPIFHAAHIHDFAAVFAEQAQAMCQRWRVGDTIQLEREMMALTLRIICRTMFSTDIDGLIDKMGELLRVLLAEAQSQLTFGLPIPNWLPLPTYLRQNRAIQGLHELLLAIIHKRQTQIAHGEDVPSDLLTMLLTARYDDGRPMSDTQVLHECMTIFFAGHETTAVGLTWIWVELLQHPAILARLTDEVQQVLGSRTIGYDDLRRMPYVTQVIKEALRLHPPVAAFARQVVAAFDVDEYGFKSGDTLVFSINTLHHQAEFYPNPDCFDPERFGADRTAPDRYTYMPFGAGARICVGNAFAMLEMQIVLATMMQTQRLALAPGQTFAPIQLITLRPRNGVKVQVQ
ncbi:MAG: cytochrome P450 [Caldilineaceae bacterium]|nr:cytochrome P450 [Caldilineaceae bacterium]